MTTPELDPWSIPTYPERAALARSILGHAPTCKRCARTVERALLALEGATLTEIQEMTT